MAKVKLYPHFDALISIERADSLASDPSYVARHAFHPFLQYERRWTTFQVKGAQRKKPKCRLIRYAARLDAHIFSHYRSLLCPLYEASLAKLGLCTSVVGYRRVPQVGTPSNKSNIHFAHEAFDHIRELGKCYVYALDISSFFENLNHDYLLTRWKELLGVSRLPPDHYKVFRAITRYSVLDKASVYEKLNFLGKSELESKRRKKKAYLLSKDAIPRRLCSPAEFRLKLAPDIKVNVSGHGIPQGAPLSDLLSNLYLTEFDTQLNEWAKSLGGFYMRYSDDILIATRGMQDRWDECFQKIGSQIKLSGDRLQISQTNAQLMR